jgi:glycosyltransferase involved in cell wall biosynthesis
MKNSISGDRLREIIWDVAQKYPISQRGDLIALLMVNPHLGYVTWHLQEQSVARVTDDQNRAFAHASPVVRVYDVTDIIFDGSNAHTSFDLAVGRVSGNYYFRVDRLGRNYLAEVGLKNRQGVFYPLNRSNTAYFDRDRPSGNYQATGLFVGHTPNRIFSVDSIFDAPVYERMNDELVGYSRIGAFSVAMVFPGMDGADLGSPLGKFIENLATSVKKLSGDVRLFTLSPDCLKTIKAAHGQSPFHIIHCHGSCTAAMGISLKKELNLPLVLTLHTGEFEPAHEDETNNLTLSIFQTRKEAIAAADLVIVSDTAARQLIITAYAASPEKGVIITDALDEKSPDRSNNHAEIRGWFGLNRDAPTALFAGEISYAAGADLLVDTLPTVCRDHPNAQFIIAGEGPLKWELESRAQYTGVSHRCRFLGDVSKEIFASILAISDFVVIPARHRQDGGLAHAALMQGRPVLTTHQAGISGIVHGQNGLVTFDNPGSIVWGLNEMLKNPLKGTMMRLAAKKKGGDAASVEAVAVRHFLYYEMLLHGLKKAIDV